MYCDPTGNISVRIGDYNNEDVKTVQTLLMQAGYYVGEYGADGDFGKDTLLAVNKFKRDYKLTNNTALTRGVVGDTTFAYLIYAASHKQAQGILKDGTRSNDSVKIGQAGALESSAKQNLQITLRNLNTGSSTNSKPPKPSSGTNTGTSKTGGATIGPMPTYQPTDTNTITINGVTYKIFVPGYNNGTNSNIDSGGWEPVKTYNTIISNFNGMNMVATFGASNPQDPGLKIEPNYVYSGTSGGSKTIVDEYGQGNKALTTGYGLQLLSSTIESFCNSWENTPLQLVIQTNGSESRVVIQVGINYKYVQDLAGKSLITTYDKDNDMKITIDEKHYNDLYTGYISINSDNKFVFTPKVYAGDRFEIGHDHLFSGWETDYNYTDALKRSMVLDEDYKDNLQGDIGDELYNLK